MHRTGIRTVISHFGDNAFRNCLQADEHKVRFENGTFGGGLIILRGCLHPGSHPGVARLPGRGCVPPSLHLHGPAVCARPNAGRWLLVAMKFWNWNACLDYVCVFIRKGLRYVLQSQSLFIGRMMRSGFRFVFHCFCVSILAFLYVNVFVFGW